MADKTVALVNCNADLQDFLSVIRDRKYPYYIEARDAKPTKGTEFEEWKRLNAFFHADIVRLFSDKSGFFRDEAKEILQIRFALIEEHDDHYLVESVAGMSYDRLQQFTEQCMAFLRMTYGDAPDKYSSSFDEKVKKIKKA